MSTEATLSTATSRRSYRCYNCNHAFHITTSTTSAVSSSFRCPRCFHRHLLPNYTISDLNPPPQPILPVNISPTNSFITVYSSDSDSNSDFTDSDDFSFDLFNSTTRSCSPTTLKSFVDSLPSVKIDESSKSCSICMEEFEIDSTASQLPCGHIFHNDCIVPWLNCSNTCPLCRHKLPVEDETIDDGELELIVVNTEESLDNNDYNNYYYNNFPRRGFLHSIEVGEDDDEWDREEMHDEDGDILMADAL